MGRLTLAAKHYRVCVTDGKKHREAIAAFKEVRELKFAPAEAKAEAIYRSGLCYQGMG